jgi:chaperonin GroES
MIKPTNDNIIVRVIKEEKTASGIYYGAIAGHVDVIRDAKEKIQDDILRAEVLAVGPGKKCGNGKIHQMEITPGEIVRFDCKLGITLPGEREDVLMLSEKAVLAVEG